MRSSIQKCLEDVKARLTEDTELSQLTHDRDAFDDALIDAQVRGLMFGFVRCLLSSHVVVTAEQTHESSRDGADAPAALSLQPFLLLVLVREAQNCRMPCPYFCVLDVDKAANGTALQANMILAGAADSVLRWCR
jgi:hypothetical protein